MSLTLLLIIIMRDEMKVYRKVREAKSSLVSEYGDLVSSLGFGLFVTIDRAHGYRLVAQLKQQDKGSSYEMVKAVLPRRHKDVRVKTVRFGEYNPTPGPRKDDGRRTYTPHG